MTGTDKTQALIGKTVAGRYVVKSLLGAGGMGAVYLATQEPLGREIALKVMLSDLAGDDTAAMRFEKEARSISALNHPHIVTIFDFGRTEDGILYIAMEYMRGRNLSEVIEAEAPLPWPHTVPIISRVSQALSMAHAKGIIHRDLKPENIMLVEAGGDPHYVKVLDFGLAKTVAEGGKEATALTQQNVIMGTPKYMSPEQINGQSGDPRTDLYSLGVLWYEMITGINPFDGATPVATLMNHLKKTAMPPSVANPKAGIPPQLDGVILRLINKDPVARFPNADAIVEELKKVSGDSWTVRSESEGVPAGPLAKGPAQPGGPDSQPGHDAPTEGSIEFSAAGTLQTAGRGSGVGVARIATVKAKGQPIVRGTAVENAEPSSGPMAAAPGSGPMSQAPGNSAHDLFGPASGADQPKTTALDRPAANISGQQAPTPSTPAQGNASIQKARPTRPDRPAAAVTETAIPEQGQPRRNTSSGQREVVDGIDGIEGLDLPKMRDSAQADADAERIVEAVKKGPATKEKPIPKSALSRQRRSRVALPLLFILAVGGAAAFFTLKDRGFGGLGELADGARSTLDDLTGGEKPDEPGPQATPEKKINWSGFFGGEATNPFADPLVASALEQKNGKTTKAAPTLIGQANKLSQSGKKSERQKAAKFYEQALLQNPDNLTALNGWVENLALTPGALDVEANNLRAQQALAYAKRSAPDSASTARAAAIYFFAIGLRRLGNEAAQSALALDAGEPKIKMVKGWGDLVESPQATADEIRELQVALSGHALLPLVLGGARWRSGDFNGAAMLFDAHLKKHPKDAWVLLDKAAMHLSLGDHKAALRLADKASRAWPAALSVALFKARVESLFARSPRRAQSTLRTVEKKLVSPTPLAQARLATALAALRAEMGDNNIAFEKSKVALAEKHNPEIALAHAALARAQRNKKAFLAAGDNLEKAVALSRGSKLELPLRLDLAELGLFEARDFESTAKLLKDLVQEDPNQVQIRLSLAASLLALGREAEAAAALGELASIDPGRAEKRRGDLPGIFFPNDLGIHFRIFGNAEVKSAYRLLPALAQAVIQYHQGKKGDAEARLNRIAKAEKDNVLARLYLGVMAFEKRGYGAARKHLAAVLDQNRSHPLAHLYLAQIDLAQGELEQAEAHLEVAAEAAFLKADAALVRGQIALKRKNMGNAKFSFAKAWEADSSFIPNKAAMAKAQGVK
jgi:serine/threonine-protein kinase